VGNICRSPTAEGIFRQLSSAHSSLKNLEIDSCGTTAYHVGEPSDPRSIAAAKSRGYDLSKIRSRKITSNDLNHYDYIFSMDNENLANILALASGEEEIQKKICLFLDYSNESSAESSIDSVPDPYYGGASGFDDVIDLIEAASRGFISYLLAKEKHS